MAVAMSHERLRVVRTPANAHRMTTQVQKVSHCDPTWLILIVVPMPAEESQYAREHTRICANIHVCTYIEWTSACVMCDALNNLRS
jgi:hypothetical protein